ncbi:MAG: sugar phosphate isomerase/epimerase [Thermoguttaceae bacterium]|jgi:sugar phosphate isomerase/epimerase|nr:sugar phosphate isomerase/epimerase [Thermoguttaceae bacterium]MBQ2621641.1 sugar phosphate isomerase/epimerase [Thermoguttaceae bacterium]
MGKIGIGLNLEAVRTSHKSFEWGVQFAKELGYEYIEPMVHWGRELLSEARYFHSVSMLDDPFRVRDAVEAAGLKLSALSSHSQLSKPEIAVEYLKQAARFAKECGAPIINTHEGHKQTWTTEEEDFVLIKYSIMEASKVAARRGIKIGLETHQTYSLVPDKYERILNLVDSPYIGANFDTGNAYLGGLDPVEQVERFKNRIIHMHAKDISVEQSNAERGKVMGTAVGCACGDGVIDWEKIVAIIRPLPQDIVLSVECGSLDQAARSIDYLRKVVGK